MRIAMNWGKGMFAASSSNTLCRVLRMAGCCAYYSPKMTHKGCSEMPWGIKMGLLLLGWYGGGHGAAEGWRNRARGMAPMAMIRRKG